MYYRATFEDRGRGFSDSSGGFYEAVTDDGELDATERGLTNRSDIREICASKSPEGALLGAIQPRQASGQYFLYRTQGEPDVDVSGASARDFGVLEEVRFRPSSMPVRFELEQSVTVPRQAVVDVQEAYGGGRMSHEAVADTKRKLRELLETGQYPVADG